MPQYVRSGLALREGRHLLAGNRGRPSCRGRPQPRLAQRADQEKGHQRHRQHGQVNRQRSRDAGGAVCRCLVRFGRRRQSPLFAGREEEIRFQAMLARVEVVVAAAHRE